jgi:tetratricopeptide (TPR) repeat protein
MRGGGKALCRRQIPLMAFATFLTVAAGVWGQAAPAPNFDGLLRQGFEYHQREDYADSIPLLRRAWKLQPHNYFVNLLLGIDLLRTGDPGAAVIFLKEASRIRPEEDFPYEYRGEAESDLGHFAQAAIAYAQAVRVAPQSPQATVGWVDFSLARFATLSSKLRSSREGLAAEYRLEALAHPLGSPSRLQLLRRSKDLDGNGPGIWSELALAEIAGDDWKAAQSDTETAQQKDPNDLRAWAAEAMLAAENNDWPHAIERLNAISTRSPATLEQVFAEWPAKLQPPEGQAIPSGAALAFVNCLKSDHRCTPSTLRAHLPAPETAAHAPGVVLLRQQRWEQLAQLPVSSGAGKETWLRYGTALAHMNECQRAIPALERGFDQSSAAVQSMFLLSWCYAQEAGSVAQRVQQSDGEDAPIHIMRGDIFLRLQANSTGAIAEYAAALRMNDKDPSVWDRLAEAQLSAGQVNSARTSAQNALRLDPHRLSAKQTLAKIAMQERQYDVALPYLRQLVEHDPRDVSTRVQLGTACAQTGALQEALRNLEPALESGYPDQKGSLHYLLGTVFRKLGKTSEANAAFAAARQLSDAFQHSSYRDPDDQP